MKDQETKIAAVFAKAKQLAEEECKRTAAQYFGGNDGGACGFAWVTVRPATGPFVAWCKKQKALAIANGTRAGTADITYGSKAWNGGWQFWNPGGWGGQSIDVKEAGAVAFRNVLAMELGLNAETGSRLD